MHEKKKLHKIRSLPCNSVLFLQMEEGDAGRMVSKQNKKKKRAVNTDLQSAFDQIEGNHSRVCGATAQNPTKATQDEILL